MMYGSVYPAYENNPKYKLFINLPIKPIRSVCKLKIDNIVNENKINNFIS